MLPALTPGVLSFPSGAQEQVALVQVALTLVALTTLMRSYKLEQADRVGSFSASLAVVSSVACAAFVHGGSTLGQQRCCYSGY